MDRSPTAEPNRRSVAVAGGLLNRYWDENTTPRPEGFWEDLQTAAAAGAAPAAGRIYRHLRAAAKSGWDFSSRWIAPTPAAASAEAQYLSRTSAPPNCCR